MGRATEFIDFLNTKKPNDYSYSKLTITRHLRVFKSELIRKNTQKED